MKENKRPKNSGEQFPDIPVDQAWGEMDKLLNLHMPVEHIAAKGTLVSKGMTVAIKLLSAVACAAAVGTGIHYYTANRSTEGEKNSATVVINDIHRTIDTTNAVSNNNHEAPEQPSEDGTVGAASSANVPRSQGVRAVSAPVAKKDGHNTGKYPLSLKTKDETPLSTSTPGAAVATPRPQQKTDVAAVQNHPPKLVGAALAGGTQPENNGQAVAMDNKVAGATPSNSTMADSAAFVAQIPAHSDSLTGQIVAAHDAPGVPGANNNILPITAPKASGGLLKGVSVGIQNSFRVPVGGTGSYFVHTNGKTQPLVAFVPDLWFSKQFLPKHSVAMVVSPLFKLYTNNFTTLKYRGSMLDSGNVANVAMVTHSLVKATGSGAQLLYKYEPNSHWQLLMGMGYGRINRGLMRTTAAPDSSSRVITSQLWTAKLDTLDAAIVRQSVWMGRVEVAYAFKWLSIGAGMNVPITPASNTGSRGSFPVNWDVYLRYRLFKWD